MDIYIFIYTYGYIYIYKCSTSAVDFYGSTKKNSYFQPSCFMIVSYGPMRICFWSQKTKGLSYAIPEPGGFGKYHRFLSFKARGEKNPHVCHNVRIQHGHSTKKCKFHGFKPFGLSNNFPVYPIVFPLGLVIYSPFCCFPVPLWLVP